jgi:hypothetical protein
MKLPERFAEIAEVAVRGVPWLAVAMLCLAPVARGDWLVTREGSSIETRGPWEVRGRLLVFTLPDGKLASMRVSEVDLEASERATREAKARPPEPKKVEPPPKKQAVVSLTDDDFSRGPLDAAGPETDEAEGAADGASAPVTETSGSEPKVASWQRSDDPVDGHVVITGTLQNPSRSAATDLGVSVRLYDDEGELITERPAILSVQALAPGGRGTFRAEFPDVYRFGALKFQVRSSNFATRETPEAVAEEGGENGGDEPPAFPPEEEQPPEPPPGR